MTDIRLNIPRLAMLNTDRISQYCIKWSIQERILIIVHFCIVYGITTICPKFEQVIMYRIAKSIEVSILHLIPRGLSKCDWLDRHIKKLSLCIE